MHTIRLTGLLLIWGCSLVQAQDNSLKQVLFLGDALHGQIVRAAQNELKDQVKVTVPSNPIHDDSGTALKAFNQLVGETSWDLIYFNFGIGDLTYIDPKTKERRLLGNQAGGVRVSSPEAYRKNLQGLVKRLKKTEAHLLWGSTTPLAQLGYSYRILDQDSELAYNQIAAEVMAKAGIPIVDLHSYISRNLEGVKRPPNYSSYLKHFSKSETPLQLPLVKAWRGALGLGN